MDSSVAKSKKSLLANLTTRQKIILCVSILAGGVTVLVIVLVLINLPKAKLKEPIIDKLEESIGEISVQDPPMPVAVNEPGKTLQAKAYIPRAISEEEEASSTNVSEVATQTIKSPVPKAAERSSVVVAPASQPKTTKVVNQTSEIETESQSVKNLISSFGSKAAKVNFKSKGTKNVTKDQSDSQMICKESQEALLKALKNVTEAADLEALYAKMQTDCKETDPVQFIRQKFEARKAEIFACERPPQSDLSDLQTMQNNIMHLDKTYKPGKPLREEFCEHFGNRFTSPFSKVEANPDIPDAKDRALEALKYFHAAFTFCTTCTSSMKHPAYEHCLLEDYLTEKIKQLLDPLHADAMNYIKILRFLDPTSPYAFVGCNDLEAVRSKHAKDQKGETPEAEESEDYKLIDGIINKTKLTAEQVKELEDQQPKTLGKKETELVVRFEDINISHGLLSIETIKTLDDKQLEELRIKCEEIGKNPPEDKTAIFAADANSALLDVVKHTRGMDGTAKAWMDNGFHVLRSEQFQEFAKKQLDKKDRGGLVKAMKLAAEYHRRQKDYMEACGFMEDSDNHMVEGDLASFLEEAFERLNDNVMDTVLWFATPKSIGDVGGLVNFFAGLKDLKNMPDFFADTVDSRNKQGAIYRLVIAKLKELNIQSATKGLNVDAPKDYKDWFAKVTHRNDDQLAPALKVAKNKEDSVAAKNDLLPESKQEKNDQFDAVYRSATVLWDMREHWFKILDRLQEFRAVTGIMDFEISKEKMKELEVKHPDEWKFIKENKKILEYISRGIDSKHASDDILKTKKQYDKLKQLSKSYKSMSAITGHFSKDPPECVLIQGSISCQNKPLEFKLRELEHEKTKEGHGLFLRFLDEARKLGTPQDVQTLASSFLSAERAECNEKLSELEMLFGEFFTKENLSKE